MNLVDVVVASALFLGACSGAAQMGASSAQAMTQVRRQGQLQEQVEAQFLAAAALLGQTEPSPDRSCEGAAQQLHSQLAAGLPPVPVGLVRQLSLVPARASAGASASTQVQLTLTSEGGLRRQRWYSPAAAGLCGPDTPSRAEGTDAAL
ncbi:MAG: hypothetical protein RLZZ336_1091 [Cyanobacteriota bacterium]